MSIMKNLTRRYVSMAKAITIVVKGIAVPIIVQKLDIPTSFREIVTHGAVHPKLVTLLSPLSSTAKN